MVRFWNSKELKVFIDRTFVLLTKYFIKKLFLLQENGSADLPGPHILPAPEAHGGRQDPFPGKGARADIGAAAYGGEGQRGRCV